MFTSDVVSGFAWLGQTAMNKTIVSNTALSLVVLRYDEALYSSTIGAWLRDFCKQLSSLKAPEIIWFHFCRLGTQP